MRIARKIFGIRADWKALTFCILAACTFWLLNALNQDYTDTISYPFKVEYNDSLIVPVEELPEKIRINVTAYGWVMLRKSLGINAQPITYPIEKIPRKNYLTSATLEPLISKQLNDLRLNFMVTDTVFIKFEKLKKKELKVFVDTSSLSLASYYHIVGPVLISPETVMVQGPSSLIKELPDSVAVEINGDNLKGEFEETIKIPESRFDVRLKLLNKEVKVRFTADRFEKENIVLNLKPVRFPEDTSRFVFDRKIILTYFVREEDKEKIKPEDFKVILDYRKMDRKDSSIIPTLSKKPAFIKDQYFTPYAVRVRKKE